jgi:hypothetical protein
LIGIFLLLVGRSQATVYLYSDPARSPGELQALFEKEYLVGPDDMTFCRLLDDYSDNRELGWRVQKIFVIAIQPVPEKQGAYIYCGAIISDSVLSMVYYGFACFWYEYEIDAFDFRAFYPVIERKGL